MKRLSVNLAAKLLPWWLKTQGEQRLSILIYHRVLSTPDPMRPGEPDVEEFDWQMRLLRNNFNPVSLLDALEGLLTGTLPDRAVCVTLDDGYADNEACALPILRKYQIPATVFISTGFLNGGRMWNDSVIETLRKVSGKTLDLSELDLGCYSLDSIAQRLATAKSIIGKIKYLDPQIRSDLVREIEKRVPSLPNDLMLTDTQVQNLARSGILIGAHTVNHPILCSVSDEIARKEISESKVYLEELLQMPVDAFAYPNGRPGLDYRDGHRDMVKDLGFKAAVSTHCGVSTNRSDQFQMPRFTPWDRTEFKFAVSLLKGYRQVDALVL